MTESSNESYISDATYSIIVLDKPMKNIKDKYLAYIDNYGFIYEWYLIYKLTNNIIGFFDMTSKYIGRCAKCLIDTKFTIDKQLVDDANYWRNNIRGKIPLSSIINKSESITNQSDIIIKGNEIIKRIDNIDGIYNSFNKIYLDIEHEFVNNKITQKFVNDMKKIRNDIPVSIANGKININNEIKFDKIIESLAKL